ncbi:MAG: HAD family phosphatase [Planctomycetota bacterium]
MPQSVRHVPQQSWAHDIRAVAFDMDGLMVNTEDLYTQVGDELLQRRQKSFTPALKKEMMGLPGPKAFQVMIEFEGLSDSVDALATESEQIFEGLLERELRALPGLFELFECLENKRIPKCVATSSTRKFASRVVELLNATHRFEFVITAEDVEHGKPAPDIYLAAAARLGVPAEQMLVLEDSQHGSQAGLKSGACTIAVPGAHSLDHCFDGVYAVADSLADPLIQKLVA